MTPLVEFKPVAGLGGWRRGELVSDDGRRCAVRADGKVFEVPRSRVRPLEPAYPPRSAARLVVARDLTQAARTVRVSQPDFCPVPKPARPWRSAKYRRYVCVFPCASCGRSDKPRHAHHHGGKQVRRGVGQRVSDAFCIPLCAGCHTDGSWCYHATGRFPGLPELDSDAAVDGYAYRLAVQMLDDYHHGGKLDPAEISYTDEPDDSPSTDETEAP